ncbi:MAG TPA: hypothetical protein VHE78_17585 [Gemmatimonadaceae bacterium]|nr:hypothetical protein [Gemmatimonadaceae bacterium]
MHSRSIAAAVILLSHPPPSSAQVTSVDEGSFTLMRAGERVGREDFWIRSAPASGGQVLVAQGTIVLGSRRVKPGLNADTSGSILRFQSEVRRDGRVVESYSGQTTRDHYAARTQRANGESAREFRLPAGTVAADDDVIHELWFVVRRGAGATVPVLVPGRNVVERVRVEFVGDERVALDVRELDARHITLRTDGSGVRRDVWIDARGRILKVAIPHEKLVALREDLR